MASPRQHNPGMTRSPPSFLELSPQQDWGVMSTRGQSLPGLIRRYSLSEGAATRDTDDLEQAASAQADQASGSSIERPHRRGSILIGDTTSPFRWSGYYTPPVELKNLRKPVREYYERMNYLVSRYSYVDRLLDSSIARDLLEDYERLWAKNQGQLQTITEEQSAAPLHTSSEESAANDNQAGYNHLTERTPLLVSPDNEVETEGFDHEHASDARRIVMTAIYINLTANCILLAAKIVVTVMTSSVSVLASLVDAALDFLSTAIIWSTTRITTRRDRYRYPVGRQRLEPVGVLIFSVVMITSFFQVALVSLQRLTGDDHSLIELTLPAIIIMASTVAIKGLCWVWCRRVNNSNVQALAQDAMTDIVFNIFSIIFPLVGTFANLWFLDSAGGLFLSFYVIFNWASTAKEHIAHLTGAAASPDDRSVFLYLVMRFAACIRWVQNLEAYHSGDRLNVEVDVVLDETTTLHDSHDIGESLQYMLENVTNVDRAFVHLDYAEYNLPTHVDHTR